MFRQLFDRDVEVAEADPSSVDPDELVPAERAQVANTVERRRQEYAAGRVLARELLSRLGVRAKIPLLADDSGAPRWPCGFVGSITHCRDLAVVAVARSDVYASIGVDVEPRVPLPEETAARVVCTPMDRANLETGVARGILARVIFSAKEAACKLQYPLTRTLLDFGDVEVSLAPDACTFEAHLCRRVGHFDAGYPFHGRLVLTARHIATAASLPASGHARVIVSQEVSSSAVRGISHV